MVIKRIPAGVYAANCYILMDEISKETAVIDPGGDADDLIKAIKDMGCSVKCILLTHGHADHTGAAAELKEYFSVPVCISEKDERMILNGEFMYGSLTKYGKADSNIKEGDVVKLGNMEVKCIETPGHTPGGVCFVVENTVFTGDTLFLNSIGRTDFAGGDFDTLINSIKLKLMILKDDTKVLPGHGLQSTIKNERLNNPFL
jgi:hydroxyacylglutathione hydrolase